MFILANIMQLLIFAVLVVLFIPIVIMLFAIVMTLSIAGVKYLLWKTRIRHAQAEAYRESHDAQGRRLPATSRGICHTCGRFSDRVYFLPDGARICERCYDPNAETPESATKT